MQRGSTETSASQAKLAFTTTLTGFDERNIFLKLAFEHPLSVSIGEVPDIAQVVFVEPELFVSAETGKAML